MITFRAVSKSFEGRKVVRQLDLSMAQSELSVLIGPSGCGKSTLLRMINRLITPDSGQVLVDGRDVAEADPQVLRRGIGYAIQAGGLFPHWDVARNIGTVPRLLGWPASRIAARVANLLQLVDLEPERFAHQRVARLSGGQQQRVGLARALAADPPLLLLDEPFGALDPLTRRELQRVLRRIQQETRKTMVFVTHDMDEALLLADRIFVLGQGGLAQAGTPAEIMARPASDFVRRFVGGEASAMRALAVRKVAEIMREGWPDEAYSVAANADLREALGLMVQARTETLAVHDEAGARLGHIRLADIVG